MIDDASYYQAEYDRENYDDGGDDHDDEEGDYGSDDNNAKGHRVPAAGVSPKPYTIDLLYWINNKMISYPAKQDGDWMVVDF